MDIQLEQVDGVFAVAKLGVDEAVPPWAMMGHWWAVSKTKSELSVVCPQDQVPIDVLAERDWRMLKVSGQLDFSLVGILAALTKPLAEAGISVFAVSTFDTDYLLVKDQRFSEAVEALTSAGFSVK